MAVDLATALHHSAQRLRPVVEVPREEAGHVLNFAPRGPRTLPPPEPQVRAATVDHVAAAASVPSVAPPVLAAPAAEGIDASTLRFLTAAAPRQKEVEEMEERAKLKKAKEAKEAKMEAKMEAAESRGSAGRSSLTSQSPTRSSRCGSGGSRRVMNPPLGLCSAAVHDLHFFRALDLFSGSFSLGVLVFTLCGISGRRLL